MTPEERADRAINSAPRRETYRSRIAAEIRDAVERERELTEPLVHLLDEVLENLCIRIGREVPIREALDVWHARASLGKHRFNQGQSGPDRGVPS